MNTNNMTGVFSNDATAFLFLCLLHYNEQIYSLIELYINVFYGGGRTALGDVDSLRSGS